MNKYLKFILDKNFRFKVLARNGFLNKIPDDVFLKKLYQIEMRKELHLENPQTFNEKLQWLKLNDRKKFYTEFVDKYKAKEIVKNAIGEQYIVPTIGIWNSAEEINFDALPSQFVLKCTHDSGSVVVCRNKSMLNTNSVKRKLTKSLRQNFYYISREWCYKDVPPRIIAEEYLEDLDNSATVDYKFFYFNGDAKFIYISTGLESHDTAQISFYDLDGKEMDFWRSDYNRLGGFDLPLNFSDMREIADKLAELIGAPFVRVDLYSISGRIYFSEFTLYPASGFLPFFPIETDEELGRLLQLNTN